MAIKVEKTMLLSAVSFLLHQMPRSLGKFTMRICNGTFKQNPNNADRLAKSKNPQWLLTLNIIQKSKKLRSDLGSPHQGSVEMNLTSIYEDTDSIPGLTHWVKDPLLPRADSAWILSGVGQRLQLQFDPWPGNLHIL